MTGLPPNALDNAFRRIDPYTFERVVARIWELQGYETTVSSGSYDRGIDIVAQTDSPVEQKVLIQAKRYADGNKIGSQTVRNYATLHRQEPDADTVIIVTTSSFTEEAESLASDLQVKTVDGDGLSELVNDTEDDQLEELLELSSKDTESSDTESQIAANPLVFEVNNKENKTTLTIASGKKRMTELVERLVDAFEECYGEGLQFVKVGNKQNDAYIDYVNEFEKEVEKEGLIRKRIVSEREFRKVIFNLANISERDTSKQTYDELINTFGFDLISPDRWDEAQEAGYFTIQREISTDGTYDYRQDALLMIKILYELYDTNPENVDILDMPA